MVEILLRLAAIMVCMKKLAILLALLLLPSFALGQTGAYSGHSFVGGTPATTSGMESSNYMDGIIPGASITVYLTRTTTKATIYADGSNTPLSNPFFSNLAPGTNPGGFIFWAAQNQGLDIQAQGGMGNASCTTSPLCYSTATTLQVDVYPNNSFSPLPSLNCTGTGSSQVCTFSGTVQGATITDGTASLHAGSLTGAVNGTFSGTVAAGTTVSTIVNGTQYVGQGSNTTIQAAITAAGATGSVAIPAGYAGTDSYTNPLNISITDQRLYNAPNTLLQMNSIFPLMDMAAGGNVQQIAACISNNACTIVFLGDSITEGISEIASENNWVFTVQKSLQQHYPNVVWTFLNYSLGGEGSTQLLDPGFICHSSPAGDQWFRPLFPGSPGGDGPAYSTWPVGCTSGQNWLWHVTTAAPDMVFYAMGQNDAGIGEPQEYANDLTFINDMAALPKSPTVVLVTNTESTLNTAIFPISATQNPILLQIQQMMRDLGKQYNLPVMDAGRLYLLYRDGTDYAQTRFTMQPDFEGFPNGTLPQGGAEWTQTGSPSVAGGVMTMTGGSSSANLNVQATDFVMTAQISGMTVGITQAASTAPVFKYRWNATTGQDYSFIVTRCNASCGNGANFVNIALYYNTTTLSSVNAVSSATTFNIWGRVEGAHHQWYLLDNSLGNAGAIIAQIDYYDYNYLGTGVSAIQCEQFGCTVGLFRDYPGNPQTVLAVAPIPEASLIGINDWYPSNPWNSMGGDAIHHPSAIGHDAFYAAAFAPVLKTIDQAVSAGTPAPNYSSALVENGNFVQNTSGWKTTYSTVSIARSTTSPWTTNGAALAITTTARYQGAQTSRKYAASAGQTYNLSAQVKSDGVFSVYGEIIAYDGAGNVLNNAITTPSISTSWTAVSASLTMPANTAYFNIEFARYDAGGGTQTGYVTGVVVATPSNVPVTGTVASPTSGTAVALPISWPSSVHQYALMVTITSGADSSNYGAFATVISGTSLNLVPTNTSYMTLTKTGTTVYANQTSGAAQTIAYSYVQIE